MAKRKSITAGELLEKLANDSEFLERQAKRDAELQREAERLARAEAPLVSDLRTAGAAVSSVWDLVNTRKKYPKLVPILIAHLDRNYPEEIREGIARALAVREARIGWDKLVSSYLSENGPVHPDLGVNNMKWALHLAIATAADLEVIDELIRLAADRRHGQHRSLFIDALSRMDDPRARAALEELKDDPDLAEAFERLAKRQRARRE